MFEMIFYVCTVCAGGGSVEPGPNYLRIPAPVPAYRSKGACIADVQELLKAPGEGASLAKREDVITACEPVEA
jgi:hypothetical protein